MADTTVVLFESFSYMKLRFQKQRTEALTRVEILVIIAVLAILAALFLPRLTKKTPRSNSRTRALQINCVNNLKQVGLSFRIWEGDNNNQYPMSVSVTNGGGRELIAAGNVAGCFQVMSNELSTPKILVCPADKSRVSAASFQKDFDNSHVSYFIGLDASESYPKQIMSGDDNLADFGVPVKSGLVLISSDYVSWIDGRHGSSGNILYADGSVSEVSVAGLHAALRLATNGINAFAIP
jgi:prepilin-type processing-associated H-X9-DG protein